MKLTIRHFAQCSALAALLGCGKESGISPSMSQNRQRQPVVALRDAITPEVMHSLNRTGEFVVGVPTDEPGVEIGATQAAELALAFVREYAPYNRTLYENATKMSLRFDELQADPRVFYAASPYKELSDRYSKPMHKATGGYYIVNLSQDGIPALSVAVSARASDLVLRGGRVVPPKHHGNEFRVVGIPRGAEFPITPERAARLASEQTGVRVAATPTLVAPARGTFLPHQSRWRLILSSPVLAAPGRSTDTVYVEWSGAVVLATSDGGSSDRSKLTLASSLETGVMVRELVNLPGRPGFASRFVQATFSLAR